MKKLSVLILIAALSLVGWALPAGAEKIRMTDAELDGVAAGLPFPCGQVCVLFDKAGGVAGAGISASGNLMGPQGSFAAGGGAVPAGGIFATIRANGHLSSPTGGFTIEFTVPGIGRCIAFGTALC